MTDAGSVKGSVVEDARAVYGEVPPFFVPGHPIAGTERSGAGAAFASLYHNRRVILTPSPETDAQALSRVEAMWRQCGADVTLMSVEHHDEILAASMCGRWLVAASSRNSPAKRFSISLSMC